MNMKKKLILTILFSLLFALPQAAKSDIYKFIDKDGVIHFTDTPTSKKFRLIYRDRGSKVRYSKASYANAYPSPLSRRSFLSAASYDQIIKEASFKYNIHTSLLKAMIKAESNFNPYAVSPKGAMGLMQLMPQTARELSVVNPYDPYENVLAGSRYMRYLLDYFGGNLNLALAAHNSGRDNVIKYGYAVPPFPETVSYVRSVLYYYNSFGR